MIFIKNSPSSFIEKKVNKKNKKNKIFDKWQFDKKNIYKWDHKTKTFKVNQKTLKTLNAILTN